MSDLHEMATILRDQKIKDIVSLINDYAQEIDYAQLHEFAWQLVQLTREDYDE